MQPDIELCPLLYTRASGEPNHFLESLAASGVRYHALHVDASSWKYLNPLRNLSETFAYLGANRFDLIHTHGYRSDLIGIVAAKRFGIPIVSTCHGFISIDRNLSVYNRLDVFALRYFDRVIAVSEQMKGDLMAKGVVGERIQVIPNAMDVGHKVAGEAARGVTRARMGIRDDEFVFGFVGRLSEEKGLRHLLEALRRWVPGDSQWRLILVGEGPQREALEQTVRDFGLTAKVKFAGFQRDTGAWYPAMDAFVLPSLTEGTPMVVLEAMAHGVPVIATSVGGVPALVANGRTGLLVPPARPLELLEAMQSLLGDGELRRRLRDCAADRVRTHYGVGSWTRKVSQVYAAACG